MIALGNFTKNFLGTPIKLGQASSPSPALVTRGDAFGGGEPNLSSALSGLASDEVAEYKNWDSIHKTLFLMGYEWLAVSVAKSLERMDGSTYTGFFQQALSTAGGALDVASGYRDALPEDASAALASTLAVEQDGQKTLNKISDLVKKYKSLRDRVAWELGAGGESVEYEVVGDDPANPGFIFKRHVGPDALPDVSAVFSQMSPGEAFNEGVSLEDSFANLGVPFKRLDLSGANLDEVGQMPILALTITLVIGVLAFYYLHNRAAEGGALNKAVAAAVMADATLSTDQKAALIEKLKASDSFFSAILGTGFSWTAVIVGTAVAGLAFFVLPEFLAKGMAR